MRRDFVNAEVEAEAQAAPPAPPAAWPAYPAPRRAAESVIHQKAKQGELLWVKAALDAGADIGDREGPWGRTLLHVAATDNRLALARLLLDRGADPGAQCQERQCTPLHDAVDGGHVEMAKFLISRHAPPDMFDLYGWTPLLRATAQGSAALVDLLANTEGVDLEAAPPDGVRSTALHMVAVAAGGGGDDAAVALAETLLKAGAKADSRDAAGRTPLHRAARNGAVAVAAALVAAGANVNALSTERGWSPLMYACHYAHEALAFALLDAGADARVIDLSTGATAVVLADQAGAEAIRLRLLAAGAGAGAAGSFLSDALAALTCSAPACAAPGDDDDDALDAPAWMPIACAGKRKNAAPGAGGVRVISDDGEEDEEEARRSAAAAEAAAERGRRAAAMVAEEAAAEEAAAAAALAEAAEAAALDAAAPPPARVAAAQQQQQQPPGRNGADPDEPVDASMSAVAAAFFGADEAEEPEADSFAGLAQQAAAQRAPPAFQGFGTLAADDGAFEPVDLNR